MPERIVVLGGDVAVSPDVEAQLADLALADTADEVTRLEGKDRFGTAAAVAGEFADGDVVYVARGTDFPDALAGAARAGLEGAPVLLTRTESVPAATLTALAERDPERIVVIGGDEAVSDDVVEVLEGYADDVDRLAGEDRYGTAVAVSGDYPSPAPAVFIATGEVYADALTGGPLAARLAAPVLLTHQDELPLATREELDRLAPSRIIILGGTTAVSAGVEEALMPYLD